MLSLQILCGSLNLRKDVTLRRLRVSLIEASCAADGLASDSTSFEESKRCLHLRVDG